VVAAPSPAASAVPSPPSDSGLRAQGSGSNSMVYQIRIQRLGYRVLGGVQGLGFEVSG